MNSDILSVLSGSEEETKKTGAKLASRIALLLSGGGEELPEYEAFRKYGEGTPTVAVFGDLGFGKTVFVRGMASVLTPDAPVQSPSYTIVNEYKGAKTDLYHFDMYRINGEDDLLSIGFYDYSGAVLAIEWSEKIPYALPSVYWRVSFTSTGENSRRIEIGFVDSTDKGE